MSFYHALPCLSVCVWLLLGVPLEARSVEQVELRWEEIGPRVTGQRVELLLSSGTRVAGTVTSFSPGALRLRWTREDRTVTRGEIARFRLTRRGVKGRLLGMLGAAALAGGIVLAVDNGVDEGIGTILIPALEAGAILGAAAAGYYVGKHFDARVTEITVAPDH